MCRMVLYKPSGELWNAQTLGTFRCDKILNNNSILFSVNLK